MSKGKYGRKDSKWRDRVFYQLCIRDEPCCSKCKAKIRKVWRGQSTSLSIDNFLCTLVYCTTNLEVDHMLPLSKGGSNEYDNLWLLCRECHKDKTALERSGKLDWLYAEWLESRAA